MSVGSKYQNLPNIAFDQPDTYGDADLNESDSLNSVTHHNTAFAPHTNDASVEVIEISIENARKTFNKSILDASKIDFSNCIAAVKSVGYGIKLREYAQLDEEDDVTNHAAKSGEHSQAAALQRFHRLQEQVCELIEQVNTIKSVAASEEGLSAGRESELERLVNTQKQRMIGQQLEDDYAIDVHHRADLPAPLESAIIAAFSASNSSSNAASSETFRQLLAKLQQNAPQNSQPVLERFSQFSQTSSFSASSKSKDAQHQQKMAKLEQRLVQLEAALGPPLPSRSAPSLSMEANSHSPAGLCEAEDASEGGARSGGGGKGEAAKSECAASLSQNVRCLVESRSNLLENHHVTRLEPKLSAILARLQRVTEFADRVAAADTQNKTSELFKLVQKWKSESSEVPDVLQRLRLIKILSDKAENFPAILQHLETQSEEIGTAITSQRRAFEQMQNKCDTEFVKFQSCIEPIEKSLLSKGK